MAEWTAQVPGISLRQTLPEAEVLGAADVCVTSCSADSRSCRAGDLFVALPGTRNDGHAFVAEAARAGAVAVLTDRPAPGCTVPTVIVPDPRDAYGRVCQALMGYPSRQMKVIGVTGTNGKTTTTRLIASVLEAAGFSPGVLGTLGYGDSIEFESARWTTPPAPVLASWMARFVASGCTHTVMEVSSHALSQSRVAGIEFDVACLTNVGHDHLDYHGTPERYRAAKQKLFNHLLPEGFAVFNADDPACVRSLSRADGPVLSIGIDAQAELTATPLEQYTSEQTFLLNVGTDTVPVRTHLIGNHNIYNCLMAAAVGLTYGIDLGVVVRGLEAVESVPGRLQRIECGQPFGVFVDYAHTPEALSLVLESLRSVTPGRLICVFGAGGDRDRSKRAAMGRAVESAADLAIVTDDNPRTEPSERIVSDILQGFRHRALAHVIADRAEAIAWALSQAAPGDCVLIAGKGHERHQIIGQQSYGFDDVDAARRWLYESAPAVAMPRAA